MARSRKSNTSTTHPETVPGTTPDSKEAPLKTSQCDHVFVGGADGVECTICGLKLTTEEYRELLKADS